MCHNDRMQPVFPPKEEIASFSGDAIVCPCDVYLPNKRAFDVTMRVYEKAGDTLYKELEAVGFVEYGHAVIVRGHGLDVKHLILFPCTNSSDKKDRMTNVLLHQAINALADLLEVYKINEVAIAVPPINFSDYGMLKDFWKILVDKKPINSFSEISTIIKTILINRLQNQ